MRINAESDIQRMREQLAEECTSSRRQIDNLRKALDDMRYKSEEAIRNLNIKNEELENMMDQMESLGQIITAKNEEIVDHKSTIATLEMKNRKLNDLVNKTIYGKTQDNIDKTINIFKRNPKLASDPRMQEIMY